jgi:NDP-sugar pyrophosphorylase family protein
MKAMILAAGLGTRLRPLTNDRPKALVEINGRTLLEIALTRLREFGVRDVIINVHHFADLVCDYLQAKRDFGMHIAISREDDLLDTGGGLKKAAWFFAQDAGKTEEPFILHNVDVISTIDFEHMRAGHVASSALATLAVQERDSSRQLLFNEAGQLCGRCRGRDTPPELVVPESTPPAGEFKALAFSGIHLISPQIFSRMTEDGAFSVIDSYLRLASEGEKILAFRADEYYWSDVGRPESVAQAAKDFKANLLS